MYVNRWTFILVMKQLIYVGSFSAPGYGYGLHLLFFFVLALEGQEITII